MALALNGRRCFVNPSSTSDVYYDPYDVEIYADPYPVFRRLREEAPLYYNEPHDFYALSRFDDVERALLDPKTYISGRGAVLELIKANITIPPGVLSRTACATVHELVVWVFTPRKVAALDQIRALRRSLTRSSGGRFDSPRTWAPRCRCGRSECCRHPGGGPGTVRRVDANLAQAESPCNVRHQRRDVGLHRPAREPSDDS
jgi:hypothetical protein